MSPKTGLPKPKQLYVACVRFWMLLQRGSGVFDLPAQDYSTAIQEQAISLRSAGAKAWLDQSCRKEFALAETLSSQEAPLNTSAVAQQLGFNRKTLKKYGLDADIAEAGERQTRHGKLPPKEIERRSYADKLRERDSEIQAMRRRCDALIAKICVAEGNAQRLAIDPTELWKPLPVPDRSLPHNGYRRLRK